MNNSELIWNLVKLILQKEENQNQVTLDNVKNGNKPNDQKQNEA